MTLILRTGFIVGTTDLFDGRFTLHIAVVEHIILVPDITTFFVDKGVCLGGSASAFLVNHRFNLFALDFVKEGCEDLPASSQLIFSHKPSRSATQNVQNQTCVCVWVTISIGVGLAKEARIVIDLELALNGAT